MCRRVRSSWSQLLKDSLACFYRTTTLYQDKLSYYSPIYAQWMQFVLRCAACRDSLSLFFLWLTAESKTKKVSWYEAISIFLPEEIFMFQIPRPHAGGANIWNVKPFRHLARFIAVKHQYICLNIPNIFISELYHISSADKNLSKSIKNLSNGLALETLSILQVILIQVTYSSIPTQEWLRISILITDVRQITRN